ncbi:mitochondrial distribution and morphology [Coemansia sp. RSA 990]|nr:mitochondrial distribution and morphology [Coemansia sp. RSA 990]
MESRQLRPIYSALEQSNPKHALRECDKLLRKHPNLHGARALKAFILARAGEIQEALALGQSLLDTPAAMGNMHVYRSLSMTYRALARPQEEIQVYKAALELNPNNETMLCDVFMAAARNRLFKEQHQAAVQLNKLYDDQKYLWWMTVSLYLQAKYLDQEAAKVQLMLAERLIEKLVDRLKSTEELRVYLDVLDEQGKYEQMVKVMGAQGQLAKMIANDPDLVTLRISLLVKTEDWEKAMEAAVATLDERDNWADYKLYIEALVASISRGTDKSDQEKAVFSVQANLQKWAATTGRARGARLAQVALSTQLFAAGITDIAESPEKLVWSYIEAFKHKAICYPDVMQFIVAHIGNTKDSQREATLNYYQQQLEQQLSETRSSASQDENHAQAWVTLEKLRYLVQALKGDTDPGSWLAGIDALLAFGLTSAKARKKQAACSDMALVASQRIIQAAFFAYGEAESREQLHSALFKSLCVMEAGIRLNEGNFLLKLYAIRIYLYLSCYERARAIYETLNIKNIQLDTLGHLIVGHGISLGCFAADLELCYKSISFYDKFRSRMLNDIQSVYEEETYSNIQDFLEFQSNLVQSMQHDCTHRYALRGEGLEFGSSKETLAKWKEADVSSIEHTEESLDTLHDNRDTLVMGLLTPHNMKQWNLEVLTRSMPMPGRGWIQAFSLVPQIMHHLVCADADALRTKAAKLATLIDRDALEFSEADLLFAHGIVELTSLYIKATDKNDIADHLDKLLDSINANLPEDDFDSQPNALFMLSSDAIRNLSAATELFTYMVSLRHALAAQRLPAANIVGPALSQTRKRALKLVNQLRSWIDKNGRLLIEEQWLNEDACAAVSRFVVESQKDTFAMVSKACTTSWLRSVRNILMHWEQCTF